MNNPLNVIHRCGLFVRGTPFARRAVVAAMLFVPGCASWDKMLPVPDVRPQRVNRSNEVTREFDAKRDEAQYQAALSFWKQRSVTKCRDSLVTLVERNPGHRDAQLMLLELYLAEDMVKAAVAHADAIDGFDDDAAVQHARGLAYDLTGDSARAIDCFERAVRQSPDNDVYAASFESALAAVEEAEQLGQRKNSARATEQSQTGLRRETSAASTLKPAGDDFIPTAELLKAEVCLALGQRDRALRLAENVLDRRPDDAGARQLVNRADRNTALAATSAAKKLRQPSEALSEIEPVLRTSHESRPTEAPKTTVDSSSASAEDLLRRGAAALTSGAVDEARELLGDACRAESDDDQVPTRAAVLALQHDQPALAVQLAEASLGEHPKSAPLYRVLGTAQYRQEHWQAAHIAFEQALALDNTNALAYFLMGSTLSKLGQAEAADWHHRRARQLDPRYTVGR